MMSHPRRCWIQSCLRPKLGLALGLLFFGIAPGSGQERLQGPRPPIEYTFPADECVVNVQTVFGAKGDGVTDDTEALQRALDASSGSLDGFRDKSNLVYLPNGVYRVTKTLVVKRPLGPWLYGQSRDGVVIRLDDGVQGVSCVLRTHPNEQGPTSADWFMRNLRNFTIDVGRNPEVDGIRYYSTNTGCLQQVRVIGHGKVGVNAGFLDQSGPNLVQDVEIDGFETGLLSQWIWGQTLSHITIRNCRQVGLDVSANVVAVEDLVVENTPVAVYNRVPNDWYHWSGVLTLIGGRFSAGESFSAAVPGPAIINDGILYARDVQATGYSRVLISRTERGDVAADRIDEYLSHARKSLFDTAPEQSLGLPIKPEPHVPWETDASKWLCAEDHGVTPSDGQDDTDAIERVFELAAQQGKTVVYFRGGGGSEPNWIILKRRVRVPSPVRIVMGLGWARLLKEGDGGLVVDDQSAPMVKFQNLDAFGGPPIQLINASQKSTLIAESCGVAIVGEGQGDIFVTDCPSGIQLNQPGQRCWARQLDPEGTSDEGLVINRGGQLWVLGIKHEGRGIRFATKQGGQTELLGLFNYGGYPDESDLRPLFDVTDSDFSVTGLREIAFDSHPATNKVRESQSGVTRILDKTREGGWIGWSLYRSAARPPTR
jgi:hypothetical protein